MATNIERLAFTEANTVTVYCLNATTQGSNLEATSIDFQEYGVMVELTDAGTSFRVFVPYNNIKSIGQVA